MQFLFIVAAIAILCVSAVASNLVTSIPNPGFENVAIGWKWDVIGNAKVSYELITDNPHSGKRCIVFHNDTGVVPNVYGRLYTGVKVIPNARYELSCWVRGEGVGDDNGCSHLTDWDAYTLNLPTGTFGWKKVSTTFVTKPGKDTISIGINITDECKALAIDDVELRSLGGQLHGNGITGSILANPKVIGHNAIVRVRVFIDNASDTAVALDTTVSLKGKTVASNISKLKPGNNEIEWTWNTGNLPFGKYKSLVRVLDDKGVALASGSENTDVVDSPVLANLDKIQARKQTFDKLYKQCQAKGIKLDYPTVAKTMLEQMIPLAYEDVRNGFSYRAEFAVTDFNRSLDDGIATMKSYLDDSKLAPIVKRYQTGKVDIDGLSFIGNRIDSTGKSDRGPLFFCGYGHFDQARNDIPKWPGYGVNIIQASEFGPSAVFPEEGKVNLDSVETLINTLDSAAKHNVRVDFLLSPHYFPKWAMKKYPHLSKGGGGFFKYCVDDPEAKQIIEHYIRTVVPMIKDKPALHSICLTNEPTFENTVNCDNTKQIWIDYLNRTHGDIDTLNKRYGTSYASFADVPYTGDPQAYDWIVCNQQRFANWHKWMADIVHEIAPNIPTHAKVMSTQFSAGALCLATDEELFGNLLELNGNDCYIFPSDSVLEPWTQNTSYDMQRSFAEKPIFNSENHIAPDGSTFYISPGNFRTALWQGAIHGQGATTIWVWGRTFDDKDCFLGSVMERPGCAEAVGTTCLDLNRFADEVTALETVKAPVAIVFSMSSMVKHGNEHSSGMYEVYKSLDCSGVKIDFISEKQLAVGKGAKYKMIIAPEVETITDAAFEGLRKLPASTRLLCLRDCFVRNEYGSKRAPEVIKEVVDRSTALPNGNTVTVLWPALRKELSLAGALSEYSIVDAKTSEPIWNVEWLAANYRGRTIINIINFRNKPVDVKIIRNGKEIEASDMLSLGGREKVSTLKPLTPVLAGVK